MKIIRTDKLYLRRKDVELDKDNMYIFTDNTDRDSGKTDIDENSWYSKKYGKGKHYPSCTSAVLRGLENAYPITTQKWYNDEHKGNDGRWNDSDFEEFKKIIDDDFNTILEDFKMYKNIIFPRGGIFNSKIANISKERTPILYDYLMSKCLMLNSIVEFYGRYKKENKKTENCNT